MMSEVAEQLNHAIDVLLSGRSPEISDASAAELLAVAEQLRDLPREDFKARLQRELEEEIEMTTATKTASEKVSGVREGFRTITPYLIVPDVHAEAEFLK